MQHQIIRVTLSAEHGSLHAQLKQEALDA